MSKKDEARAMIWYQFDRGPLAWHSEVDKAIDAYGAACAEEAAAVYAKQAQLATDTVAIIDGEPTRGKLKKELSAAEQRGYERGREECIKAVEERIALLRQKEDEAFKCGWVTTAGEYSLSASAVRGVLDTLRSRPQPKREEQHENRIDWDACFASAFATYLGGYRGRDLEIFRHGMATMESVVRGALEEPTRSPEREGGGEGA